MNPPLASWIETARLRLRAWRDDDLPELARLNADPRVTEFLSRPFTREESDALARRAQDQWSERGFGLWAVEVRDGAPFIGFVGLAVPRFAAAFTPCVEIGWRLAFEQWGHGYATEAARPVLAFGFTRAGLEEVVSFTATANLRSRRVMERIGLLRDVGADFDHPSLPPGHPLRRHVLYRLARSNWHGGSDGTLRRPSNP